jgi:hypothetical protein
MDIESIRVHFSNDTERFLAKVKAHVFGDDPVRVQATEDCLDKFKAIWRKILVAPMDELARVDETMRYADCIVGFVRTVDVAKVAVKADMSSTSRGVMVQLQRDIINTGASLMSACSALSNAILKNKPMDLSVISAMLESKLRQDAQSPPGLGPIFSKVVRRYAPLMTAAARADLRRLILEKTIGNMFGVVRLPIDAARPVYEQVLTNGALLPLAQSTTFAAFFTSIGEKYDESAPLRDNLARIAKTRTINVLFTARIMKNAIEFDSRALFDFEYVTRNNLVVPKFTGLCDKALARFGTIKPVVPSGDARVPFYIHEQNAEARRTLVLESLAHGKIRAVGDAIRDTSGSDGDRLAPFLVDNDHCKFLAEGQSTRADEYHRRAEDTIFANARSAKVRDVANMFKTSGSILFVADSLRSKLSLRLREYMRSWQEKVGDSEDESNVFAMCIDSLRDVLPTTKRSASDIGARYSSLAVFFAKLSKLAGNISSSLFDIRRTREVLDYSAVERHVDTIMKTAANDELFTIDESLNMVYLRQM